MTGTPDQDEPETRDVCGITAHAMLYQKNAEALNGTKPCVTSRARCAGRALTRSSAVPDRTVPWAMVVGPVSGVGIGHVWTADAGQSGSNLSKLQCSKCRRWEQTVDTASRQTTRNS
jgi:hypothetical protein